MTKDQEDRLNNILRGRSPWEERVAPLHDHFVKLGAKLAWRIRDDSLGNILVECWLTGTTSYLVRIWEDGSGWDVYKPVSESNKVEDTLAAVV